MRSVEGGDQCPLVRRGAAAVAAAVAVAVMEAAHGIGRRATHPVGEFWGRRVPAAAMAAATSGWLMPRLAELGSARSLKPAFGER